MDLLAILKDRRQLREDYIATFGTPHGRRVLAHLFKEAGITSPRLHTEQDLMLLDKGMQRLVWSIHRMSDSNINLDEEIDKLNHKQNQ